MTKRALLGVLATALFATVLVPVGGCGASTHRFTTSDGEEFGYGECVGNHCDFTWRFKPDAQSPRARSWLDSANGPVVLDAGGDAVRFEADSAGRLLIGTRPMEDVRVNAEGLVHGRYRPIGLVAYGAAEDGSRITRLVDLRGNLIDLAIEDGVLVGRSTGVALGSVLRGRVVDRGASHGTLSLAIAFADPEPASEPDVLLAPPALGVATRLLRMEDLVASAAIFLRE